MDFDADVIIIGAGVAGLTCGCLLAKKGLSVLIVEKNGKAGGCCTSFHKDGFSFDLSVQSLGECQRGGRVWALLKELDLLEEIRFISLEPAREYHFPDRTIEQSSNLETHMENLAGLFPDQREGIEKVYGILKKVFEEFSQMESSFDWHSSAAFSSKYPLLFRYREMSYGDLLKGLISNPCLRAILSVRSSYALLPPEEISVAAMAGIEMSYFNHGVSCIEGKVEELPLKLQALFQRMGGRVLFHERVERVLFEGNGAMGIRLGKSQEFSGRIVVSNIDACHTFFFLVGKDRVPSGYLAKLKGMRPCLSYFILYLGVEGGVEELPVSNNEVFFDYDLSREYEALFDNRIPEEGSFYLLVPSKVNSSHAPRGMSTLCLSYKVPYSPDGEWDQEMKESLSQRLIEKASAFVPDLKRRIRVRVETTPVTIERWTGNRRGAAYGWAQIPSQSGIYRLGRTTPIRNLYLTGHWTSPGGGISAVIASGKLTAEAVWSRFTKGEL